MRTVALNAALLMASVGINVVNIQPPEGNAATVPAVKEAKECRDLGEIRRELAANGVVLVRGEVPPARIVTSEIVLVDEFGRPRITLKASANGSGIWVGDHNGIVKDGLVSITSNGKTAAIGYYAPGAKIIDGCDFAIGGSDGRAYIQVRKKDGQFDLFDPADLKK
jgi:hypothetical protein